MSTLLPLTVAVPLGGAATLAATDRWLPAWVRELPALLVATATAVLTVVVALRTERADAVHWFGGWEPRHGVAIGIAFVADPLAAWLAALAAVLVTAALLYSWHYFAEAPRLYRALMLVFLAGMCGFALSGDLFNMFVWFELMGVAAYALTGYTVEELGPLQGAINFAITNSVGAFMVLFGTALLYARTGALNLAQIGAALEHSPLDGLLVTAFTLVVAGFLVKAAIVPFHFWLADAYAVAPAPVCVLFAAVMSELGLYAVARLYWTVFEGPFAPHAGAVRASLVAAGLVTALLGAAMSLLQRHLRRLLAYATISHLGTVLTGVALLGAKSLGGAAHLVVSQGLLTGALFFAAGVLLREYRSIDELELHGRGRTLPLLGVLVALAAVGLAGPPYVGTFLGHALVDDGAIAGGHGWVPPLLAVATALSAAAVLRAAARVFLGWGPKRDPLLTPEPAERPPAARSNRRVMVAVTAALVVAGLAASVVPGLQDRTESAAERFRDRPAYVARVLAGEEQVAKESAPLVVRGAKTSSLLYGAGTGLLAVAVALAALYRSRLPAAVRAAGARALGPPVDVLRAVHSGVAGDYVMWITLGTAVLGTAWALTLR